MRGWNWWSYVERLRHASRTMIPNTRGIRNDAVAALRGMKVPNVRWPGGCSLTNTISRKVIGPLDKRAVT